MITLILMILLTVIAVGLLTLSSITLRATSQGEAMALAKSNARLGLMLAIGEVQKELGPDQKITAGSEILTPGDSGNAPPKYPHLTGVWNSRQEDLNTTPDYDRQKAFQRWLVSATNPEALRNASFPQSGSFDHPVLMAGPHASGNSGLSTYADAVPVAAAKPSLQSDVAWWVADENSKGFTNPVDSRMLAPPPLCRSCSPPPEAPAPMAYRPSIPNTRPTRRPPPRS